MRYRVLWVVALGGVVVQAVLAAREGLLSLSSGADGAIIAGMAVTSASILAAALFWMREHRVGAGRPALILRFASLGIVGAVTVGALALASMSGSTSAQKPETTTLAAAPAPTTGGAAVDPAFAGTDPDTGAAASEHVHDASTTTGDTAEGAPHSHGTEVAVSDEQLAAAAKFVADVKATTAQYPTIQAAMAAGYVQLTQDLPGIAAHFVNLSYMSDGHEMDPTRPEFLLYTKRLTGSWQLVGTMFYQEKPSDTPPSYFGPLDAWHFHEDLCFVGSNVTTTETQADCKGGLFVAKTNWQLHVWLVPNPNGVFAHDLASIDPGAFPPADRPAARDLVKAP